MKPKDILIAITFFALGSILTYGYYSNEPTKRSKQLTAFTNSCIRVQQIDQQFQNSYKQSFIERIICMSNPECNEKESVKRFQTINKDSARLEQEKKSIANKLFKVTK